MKKTTIGNNVFIPMPTTIVGSTVNGKDNFMTVGFVSRVNATPPMLSIGINKVHLTGQTIRETKIFSVNFPSAGMVEKTDHVGLVSGRRVDKSQIFDVFRGETGAPLIADCPLNLDCRLVQAIELPSNWLFIGEIVGAHAADSALTDGKPDFVKMEAFLLTMPDNTYWRFGNKLADAWKVGRGLGDGK